MYALKGVLPGRDLKCWHTFVLACIYLCNHVITNESLVIIDNLLLQFCRAFENLYGSSNVTPNMHLHCRLTECIKDFGPIYNFWLFSFERYNGILGNVPTNNKTVEIQMMKRFDRDLHSLNMVFPDDLIEFKTMLHMVFPLKESRGALSDYVGDSSLSVVQKLSSWTTNYGTTQKE